MPVKTKAIVISAIRYQEKSLVVKCFTASDGLKSYFIRDAFSSRKNTQKIAYFQPLNILEVEAVHKNKGRLEYFKELKLAYPYHTLHTDIVKTAVAIFISEMLHHSIKEEEKNLALYDFLETSLLWLDSHEAAANFHLVLLLEITKFLGFYPQRHTSGCLYFEMTEGMFIPNETLSCLTGEETHLLVRLMELRFDHNAKAFSVAERQVLLKILLDYYAFHLEGFRRPNSAEVLKEVFS
ncbi:DNA repair protein RecO [Flavobacterium cyanobacteriorum]|uniref:DNA repair protein RecO n=1 Tax=Flavobacterium cyanobacteriorum TaxID=2022802 RepID=A0A255Z6V2_9FLAO|nr:DNA repair protein RecO [Flavobacterium cyanobacteriorum]OYQ36644.1 DNA repair protein RecO [Flavobacterium cyanobacteriorum]